MLRSQKEFVQIDQDTQTQNKLYLCDQQYILSLYQINMLNIATVILINSSTKQLTLKNLSKQNIKTFLYEDQNPKFNYNNFFDMVSEEIANNIKKGNVAIICTFKGYNASAACCISYLMRFKQMKYEQAFYDLKTQNCLINISVEFKRELIIYKSNLTQTTTWLTSILKSAPHKNPESAHFLQRFSRTESQRLNINNKTAFNEQEFSFQYQEEVSFSDMNQTLLEPQVAQFSILDETDHIPTFNPAGQKSAAKPQSQPAKQSAYIKPIVKNQVKPVLAGVSKDCQNPIAPPSKIQLRKQEVEQSPLRIRPEVPKNELETSTPLRSRAEAIKDGQQKPTATKKESEEPGIKTEIQEPQKTLRNRVEVVKIEEPQKPFVPLRSKAEVVKIEETQKLLRSRRETVKCQEPEKTVETLRSRPEVVRIEEPQKPSTALRSRPEVVKIEEPQKPSTDLKRKPEFVKIEEPQKPSTFQRSRPEVVKIEEPQKPTMALRSRPESHNKESEQLNGQLTSETLRNKPEIFKKEELNGISNKNINRLKPEVQKKLDEKNGIQEINHDKEEQMIKKNINISPIRARPDQTQPYGNQEKNPTSEFKQNEDNKQIKEENQINKIKSPEQNKVQKTSENNASKFIQTELEQRPNGIQSSIIKQLQSTEINKRLIQNLKGKISNETQNKEQKSPQIPKDYQIDQDTSDINLIQPSIFFKVNLPQPQTLSSRKKKQQDDEYKSYIVDHSYLPENEGKDDELTKREKGQKSPLRGAVRQSTSSGLEQRYLWRENLLSNYESTDRLVSKNENQNYRWRTQGLNSSSSFIPVNQQITTTNIMDKRNSNGNVQDQMETQSLGEYRKKYFTACIYKKQY